MALADPEIAQKLARGICRSLAHMGYGSLIEFPLNIGRRVDVIAVADSGETLIVEIKSSPADFLSDQKWQEYRAFCDLFYFAVPIGFPQELLPADVGLMVADEYGAEILRASDRLAMNGSRRKAQLLRFALTASERLRRVLDPNL